MKTPSNDFLDLGELDGPVLIFGGPYSNLHATAAIKVEADMLDIPADRVLCTGDVVAYAGAPDATTDLMMDWGVKTVMGNCEESFGWQEEDCGCGFDEGTECDILSRKWYAYADSRLSAAHRAWMRACPRRIDFTLAGRRFAMVHGSADTTNEFVFEHTDEAVKIAGLDALDVDAVIGGHSGVPFTQVFEDRVWHNAGVIGMPANDGTPRVWYTVLYPEDSGIRIEHRALEYDYAGAAEAMRKLGLPSGYADCIEYGFWPNLDVMPEGEKTKTGQPLAERVVHWAGRVMEAAE